MTAALGAGPGRSHAGFATADAGTNGGIISELGGDRHEVARTVVACFKAISSCFRACAGARALATTGALVRGEDDRSVRIVSRLLSGEDANPVCTRSDTYLENYDGRLLVHGGGILFLQRMGLPRLLGPKMLFRYSLSLTNVEST